MATLSRIIIKKAAAAAQPPITPLTRNYSSAVFTTTPLKNISSSNGGGDVLFPRVLIPNLHFFSSVSSNEGGGQGTDDGDHNMVGSLKAEGPNASLEQSAHERPDIEDLDERTVQQAFNEKNRGGMVRSRSPTLNRTRSPNLNKALGRLAELYRNSTQFSGSPYKYSRKRSIKKINLPTHYCEVNYRTLKAVVFYGPNIDHIPHGISKKDLNLLGVHQAKP
ncbi:hypothetical protein C5167_000700 [Papaver somniferum]|uniref:Uncharacterized protein n=1 Tax=Papaver somniferum TaxID=3469 RepID=A0A4Y7KUA0_PAPSO|nr:uncharacterized protein LOC113309745 [Papaver somniferum]RZC75982.1 hypothetical protein C5167_000700 [Papaver somniferum]